MFSVGWSKADEGTSRSSSLVMSVRKRRICRIRYDGVPLSNQKLRSSQWLNAFIKLKGL